MFVLWLGITASASDEVAGPPVPPAATEWPILYPGQCTPDDPYFDLEILYYEGKLQEGLAKTEAALEAAPTKDLYWLKSRFMYEIGEQFQRSDTTVNKEAHYQTMLDTVEAGLKLAPGDPHLRFARGVAMGRLGTTRGVLSSLFMAKDVETDWLSVAQHPTWKYSSLGGVELLPCDAYHALGIYYRLVPEWWIVQMIAGTRGDLDKSLSWNKKSTQCKPEEPENWKETGATQLCMGERRKDPTLTAAGIASLKKCQSLPAPRDRQKMDVKHCGMLIADPSLACEYSRDGQQDLDESKLAKP